MKNHLQIIPQQRVKFKMLFFYTSNLKRISSISHSLACNVTPQVYSINLHPYFRRA